METLFRFFVVRPAEVVDEKQTAIPLSLDTELQEKLKDSFAEESPAEKIEELLKVFASSDDYIDSPTKLHYEKQAAQLRTQIKTESFDSQSSLVEAISNVFGESPGEIVKNRKFTEDKKNCADSIITMKLLPEENRKPIIQLVRFYQTLHLIDLVARQKMDTDTERKIKKIFHSVLILPIKYSDVLTAKSNGGDNSPIASESAKIQLFKKTANYSENVESAIQEILSIRPKDLALKVSEQKTEEPKAPFKASTRGPSERVTFELKKNKSGLTIKPTMVSLLSNETKEVLSKEMISLDDTPYDDIVFKLEHRLCKTLETLHGIKLPRKIGIVGRAGTKVIYRQLDLSDYFERVDDVGIGTETEERIPRRIKPMGVGDLLIMKQQLIRYEGGDVAHVENILKSEKKSRTHRRLNETENYSVTEFESEKQQERDLQSTERFELQKEIQNTIQEQSNLEVGLNVTASYGPVSVSANFGYEREKAKEESKKVASAYAREITSKSVEKISEKVHEQLSMRIREEYEETNEHGFNNKDGTEHVIGVYQWLNKVYETQTYRYGLREMYDLIIPEPGAFLLKALSRDVAEQIGIEEPEPFILQPSELYTWRYEENVQRYEVTGTEPPPPLYKTATITLHKRHEGGDEGGSSTSRSFAEALELEIPEGYEAFEAVMEVSFMPENFSSEHNAIYWGDSYISGTVGAEGTFGFHSGKYQNWTDDHFYITHTDDVEPLRQHLLSTKWFFSMQGQTQYVPVTIMADGITSCVVAVEVKCKRTDHAFTEWQHKAHSTIMQAYLNKKAAFEEKCAAESISQGVQIIGRNPLINREMEKNELKKSCLAIIMGEHFEDLNTIESFDAIENDPANELPRIDLDKVDEQAKYIRFLEHAFEWENLTFTLYPYFWGRKDKWKEKIQFEDADKEFVDFISAGAARVVVPARLNFENAIRHFIATGKPWEGGDLPSIEESDLYVPIIQEIQEHLGITDEKPKPHGDPDRVVIPTSLVRLRPDDSLPVWVKSVDEDGNCNWVPEETTDDD